MEPTPCQRWLALKERGGFTAAEIDAVDRDTPADPRNPWAEPAWWLEMMDARQELTASGSAHEGRRRTTT